MVCRPTDRLASILRAAASSLTAAYVVRTLYMLQKKLDIHTPPSLPLLCVSYIRPSCSFTAIPSYMGVVVEYAAIARRKHARTRTHARTHAVAFVCLSVRPASNNLYFSRVAKMELMRASWAAFVRSPSSDSAGPLCTMRARLLAPIHIR